MSKQSSTLRGFVLAALAAGSLLNSGASFGLSTVHVGPGDWGCIGACGGWGDTGGGDDGGWDGGGNDSGGGGGAGDGSSEDSAIAIPGTAQCSSDPEMREIAAGNVYRSHIGTFNCIGDDNQGQYFEISFDDGSSGIYQRSDSECRASHIMLEVRAPRC